MKFKSILIIVLICTVFSVACLDSSPTTNLVNPLNKTIEPYNSAFPENAPMNDEIILYKPWSNISIIGYSNETLLSESDMILYGTLKNIQPSIWSTEDQSPPYLVYDMELSKTTFDFENGTQIEYNTVSIPECDDSIYTPVTFEVNHMVKGKTVTEVSVVIPSGQIDNYIAVDSYYPLIWDLEIGEEYLIYIKNSDAENTIMYPGFFKIIK